jgi:hypothetical protein
MPVVKIDHVIRGSKDDGCISLTQYLTDAGDLPMITRDLICQSYSNEDIHKIINLDTRPLLVEMVIQSEKPGAD